MLKNPNGVVLLDLDDCVFGNSNLWCGMGRQKDNFTLFKINIRRLQMICRKWKLDVKIISDMSAYLNYDEKDSKLICSHLIKMDEDDVENKIINYLNKKLSRYISGVSCGNKEKDIILATNDMRYSKIVIMDDSNFKKFNIKGSVKWLNVCGYISGRHIYKIKKLME